jgi:hypothetical protein
MNKAKLKAYAPQARKDFIAAVTARAHRLGLAEHNGQLAIAPAEKSGDLVIIAGQSWPAKISPQRDHLVALIEKDGFSQTMEAVAYTWFNRFAALRYMEIHDYLSHGYRVLSSRAGGLPEILNAAPELAQNRDLTDLNHQQVVELKLAGDQDGELYRLTLIAQCNALSSVMPFLFERIDNETELLLPDNLLLTDSVIAKLVTAIPEEDWQQVEIIGWLYQFYISEKKDQVIGKVVKSEDIPAATQLFTPNWIVQYLVQNSIGRLWLMANPASTLKTQWQYYIEPAEQTPEVQAQLDALIQTRIAEDSPRPEGEGSGVRGTLNPETITVLDPACGSGHILVEAYEVLKAIYLERGYQARSIPRLILENNLFGLDIDDRAAQLAGFALLMKARADDRRLFDNSPKLNVLALKESKGLDADEIVQSLNTVRAEPVEAPQIRQLINTFAHAKTFGSLIQIPTELNAQLPALDAGLQLAVQSGDLIAQEAALNLLPLVRQAQILGMQFDAVVANPPYMGGKGMNAALKVFAQSKYPDFKADMFAMFICRSFIHLKDTGMVGLMTPFVWMFIKTYEATRKLLVEDKSIHSLVHPEYHAFFDSAYVPICAFVANNFTTKSPGQYFDLRDFYGAELQPTKLLEATANADCKWRYSVASSEFMHIPGEPIVYWLPDALRTCFRSGVPLEQLAEPRIGMATCDNQTFLRLWTEVAIDNIGFGISSRADALHCGAKWFPHHKGGEFRRWYGNLEYVVNWENDGNALQTTKHPAEDRVRAHNFNLDYIFKPGLVWTSVTSSLPSFRLSEHGFLYDAASGLCPIRDPKNTFNVLGLLNSKIVLTLQPALNPTLNLVPGDLARLPVVQVSDPAAVENVVSNLVALYRQDWNHFETAWDFRQSPLIGEESQSHLLSMAFDHWQASCATRVNEAITLEEQNNRIFIDAYGLRDELPPEVPESQITLARANREKDSQRLISYAIGCMMGRYSLNEPGLIYAHAGNAGFDPDRYNSFPADADGIVPITDELWFEDDAANRIQEFLMAVWNAETLDENIAWLAESLGQKGNETPIETIRRYIAGSFFKDHLQTYKKRPIYWLFSSGKQGAFQALVYLHRYHEGTLARMRAEYVVPLTGKIQSRIEMLEKDADAADSNASRNKLNKDIEKLKKKHVELLAYDEKLRHYADLRIQLDLDDGVKVNYGKFGDLLAEVKAVTGGASDD